MYISCISLAWLLLCVSVLWKSAPLRSQGPLASAASVLRDSWCAGHATPRGPPSDPGRAAGTWRPDCSRPLVHIGTERINESHAWEEKIIQSVEKRNVVKEKIKISPAGGQLALQDTAGHLDWHISCQVYRPGSRGDKSGRDREAAEGSSLFPGGSAGLFPFSRAWCCVIWRLLSFLLEAEGHAAPLVLWASGRAGLPVLLLLLLLPLLLLLLHTLEKLLPRRESRGGNRVVWCSLRHPGFLITNTPQRKKWKVAMTWGFISVPDMKKANLTRGVGIKCTYY